jgi:hypothetical protein
MIEVESARDKSIRYVEKALYRDHVIKIARRGEDLKVLIYAPGEVLASSLVETPVSDYESAINLAKAKIDRYFSVNALSDLTH